MGATGIGLASLCMAGVPTIGATDPSNGPPSVTWQSSLATDPESAEFVPTVITQYSDSFAVGGIGRPIGATGPEAEQFAVQHIDTDGTMTEIAFGGEPDQPPLTSVSGITAVGVSGPALVGTSEYASDADPEKQYRQAARVIQFTNDGSVAWTHRFDQFADEDSESVTVTDGDTSFAAVTSPLTDGGPLAAGRASGDPWLVKFDSEGDVVWSETYDYAWDCIGLWTGENAYHLVVQGDDTIEVVTVDAHGVIEQRTSLAVDFESIPYNHVVIPTSDGGYAVTGRYQGRQRMVLQTFDPDGSESWLATYNGPYDGYDWAYDVIETEDGGFALFGRMDAAYSGDNSPAILKTDAKGDREWQTLLEDAAPGKFRRGFQTTDGGYLAFEGGKDSLVVKYGGGDSDGGEPTSDDDENEPSSDRDEIESTTDSEENESMTGGDDNESVTDESTDHSSDETDSSAADNSDDSANDTSQTNEQEQNTTSPSEQQTDRIPGMGPIAAIGGIAAVGAARLTKWRN